MPPLRTIALVAGGAVIVAIAVAFGIDWAALVVLLFVLAVGFAYSAATAGDWMKAWGRRSSNSDGRRRR
jgi:fucose permease